MQIKESATFPPVRRSFLDADPDSVHQLASGGLGRQRLAADESFPDLGGRALLDPHDDRVQLAFRDLEKLSEADLDKLMTALAAIKQRRKG